MCEGQKNVYSVYRYNPPSIGFAELSALANGSSNTNVPVPSATVGSISTAVAAGSSGAPPRAAAATGWAVAALVGAVVAVIVV